MDPITDISAVSTHEFLQRTRAAKDDQVRADVRRLGTPAVLHRVFDGFAEQLVPGKAPAGRTVVQWLVTDEGVTHPYVLVIEAGAAIAHVGEQPANVRLTADLVTFVRLLEGSTQPAVALLRRRLKVSGDKSLALRLDSIFDRP